ncbi:MAG TPA: alpha/beta fold hydrolase [Actinomycetota bacterium]|nr:alpha/beta fold hydrolase [Actinomycetota bacterium]
MTDIRPGCEPFSFDGGPVGILLLHGFTGNPASLRRLGSWLAARGHAVSCPLYPGHGREWRDLGRHRWREWVAEAERALRELEVRVRAVVIVALSFGSAIGFHLAARHSDTVKGIAVINPYLRDRRYWKAIPPVSGVGNDIRKPGEDELSAERIPVRAALDLASALRTLSRDIPGVRQPLLVFESTEDHVVPRGTVRWLLKRVGSQRAEVVPLPSSYHVATLDHDAELIFERTHEFAEAVGAAHGAR